jgi:regulator of sirC expression with transglutaminase-like and TPR domain
MDERKFNALISLLDDDDHEVVAHVEKELITLGDDLIPLLEDAWEKNFNPIVQKRIEEIIHHLQFQLMNERMEKWVKEGGTNLLEGLWILNTFQYPEVELLTLEQEIHQLYYEVWVEFQQEASPLEQLKIINNIFFGKLKFAPNSKNFHSPANSMISQVLATRKGNPISLCALYMMITQKLGLPIYGVNLPNLFILTYKSEETQFYINVFNRGIIFTKEDIDNFLHQLNLKPMDVFYQPCSNIDILIRCFRNLIISFDKLGEPGRSEELKQILVRIFDQKV